MSRLAPAVPAQVAGLRLLRMVGHGGEGEVWEALGQRGDRRALKLVRPDALADDDDIALRGSYLVRIFHPALVRVSRWGLLEAGPLRGWGYLDMEFVEGASLHGAPADPGMLERLRPLGAALDLLHAGRWSDGMPLVHRDVKPANIISTPAKWLVLVDPSALRGVDAEHYTRIGTPLFAAPEVMSGRIGPASDVYSFAATVVALTTGARGSALAELLADPAGLDLPEGVRRGLAAEPAERPVSCRALLAGDTIVLRASFPPAELPRPLPRVWPWAATFALLAAAPLAAWWQGTLGGRRILVAALVVFCAHLLAHRVAGTPPLLAALAPPVAWALLLAERAAGTPARRLAWARALLVGAVALACTPVAAAVLGAVPAGTGPRDVVAAVIAGVGLTVLAVATVRMTGGAGALLRLCLTPVWLLGATLVLAAAVLGLPLVLGGARAGPLARLAVLTVSGFAELFQEPR